MSYSQRLDLRQSQQLVMTPQLQQAIKLLQMSHLELADFIAEEIEKNPFLEEAGETGERAAHEGETDSDAAPLDMADLTQSENPQNTTESALDTDYDNHWAPEGAHGETASSISPTLPGLSDRAGGRSDFSGGADSHLAIDLAEAHPTTLREHLIAQINMDIPDPADRAIALALIDQLNESGYMAAPIPQLAETLGCPARDMERVLTAHLQQMDPPGICARNLKECLALQLREQDRYDPAMARFVEHIELLAERKLPELQKICGVDDEDLAEMIAEIRRLEPKPASGFEHHLASSVTPDILMRAHPDGGWIIELNPDALPRVLTNESYIALISQSGHISRDDKNYLNEQINHAHWLVKALDQRAQTIIKVASEIVKQQDAFFAHGVEHLKPMVLKDIADAIEMHESTVSRVTAHKYMATPRGLFELKYFFSPAIPRLDGAEATSAEAVRARIKALIAAEEASRILSDDKLVTLLRTEGVDVARRTVAKYRESLNIPNSALRRREKALQTKGFVGV